MRVVRTSGRGAAVAVMTLLGFSGMSLALAQAASGQADATNLQALVWSAISARTYAQGLVSLASAHSLDMSSAKALLASGNGSLAAAQTVISSNGDLAAGFSDVHSAMKSYTDASASASLALQTANLTSTDVDTDSGAIDALNGSVIQVASVIGQTCAATSVDAGAVTQFQQECASAKASITSSMSSLRAASALVSGVASGKAGSDLGGFAGLLSQARTDLSNASAGLAAISAATYPSRGAAFVAGPMAAQNAAANSSVKSQAALANRFKSDVSTYQTFSLSQSGTADAVNASASTVAKALSSVSMTAVSASISSQQAKLVTTLSNLTSLSQQLTTLPLPALTISNLQGNITAAKASLNAYSSALSSTSSLVGSYSLVIVNNLSSYSASLNSSSATQQADGSAFIASLTAVQTQLGLVAAQFPLLTSLGEWQATLGSMSKSVSAGSTSVGASLQAAAGGLATVVSGIFALTVEVQGASKVEVSAALLQDVASISVSENQFLNATALAALQAASASLQSDGQLASGFEASSQALLQQSVGQFGASSQALSMQDGKLRSQTQSTANAMTAASAYLTVDLNARTRAVVSAQSLMSQALSAFAAQKVTQGASLLSQASLQLRVAYSKG